MPTATSRPIIAFRSSRPPTRDEDLAQSATDDQRRMFTENQQYLVLTQAGLIPMIKRNIWTEEEEHALVHSPHCTVVGSDGVPLKTRLPKGRGREGSTPLRLHDPDGGVQPMWPPGRPAPYADRISSTRQIRIPTQVAFETDLARRTSTRLPQHLKGDYNDMVSQKRPSWISQCLHPMRYKRYLQAVEILAAHEKADANPIHFAGSLSPLPSTSKVEYPLVCEESPSTTFFSMGAMNQKPSRLQKSASAAGRDIFTAVRSFCSEIKTSIVEWTKGNQVNAFGKPTCRKLRRRKKGVSGVGSWDDEVKKVSDADPSKSVSMSPASRPSLFIRLAKRLDLRPSKIGNRLVKKRPSCTMESISSSIHLPNDLAKMDESVKRPNPALSNIHGRSRTPSPVSSIPPPHVLTPPPPYSLPSLKSTAGGSTLLELNMPDSDWGILSELGSPKSSAGGAGSVSSWDGPTEVGSSKAESVTSSHAYEESYPRGSPASIIEAMERRKSVRSNISGMSGTTAASCHSRNEATLCTDYKGSCEGSRPSRLDDELKLRFPKATLQEAGCQQRYTEDLGGKSRSWKLGSNLGNTSIMIDPPAPTLAGVVFPWERTESSFAWRGIVA